MVHHHFSNELAWLAQIKPSLLLPFAPSSNQLPYWDQKLYKEFLFPLVLLSPK